MSNRVIAVVWLGLVWGSWVAEEHTQIVCTVRFGKNVTKLRSVDNTKLQLISK